MSNFKKILTLEDEYKARLLESILEEKKIPFIIKSYYDSALDGLFKIQKGWGHVEAPEELEKEIQNIYKDIL